MSMKKKKIFKGRSLLWVIVIGIALSLGLSVCPVQAVTIDFRTGSFTPSGGTITEYPFDTSVNFTGSDIPVDAIWVAGALSGNGGHDLSGSGASGDANGSAVLSFDTGHSTNFIKIIGGVSDFSLPDTTVLLEGTISSFSFYLDAEYGQLQVNLRGPDTKDALLIPLGLPFPSGTRFKLTGAVISGDFNSSTNTGSVVSTNLLNSVPEPATMFLLGSGLIGLAGFARRKLRKP